MGTNFYLRDKFSEEKRQNMNNEIDNLLNKYEQSEDIIQLSKEIRESINNVYSDEIHIAKTSRGWKPIFQSQEGKFTSVEELKEFYLSNVDELEIID